jgi:NADH-quinone oxidoreductase subunit J
MTYSEGLFYCLSLLLIYSALLTVSAKNPVYSVLFLILSFLNGTGLLLLLGLEFLGLTFLIVYIGAISVLFLFVVMLLNLQTLDLNENRTAYLPVGLLLGLVLGVQMVSTTYQPGPSLSEEANFSLSSSIGSVNTLTRLGEVFYTEYWTLFELAGVLLLLAMVGTIRLTLHH